MVETPQRTALRDALLRLDLAEASGSPFELSSALTAVGRCYRRMNALRAAEDSLRQALRWARASGSTDLQVDLLCELAECNCGVAEQLGDDEFRGTHAARDRARDAAFEASELARQVADPGWESHALLRISDVLSRCGDHDDAAWLQSRAITLMSGGASLD